VRLKLQTGVKESNVVPSSGFSRRDFLQRSVATAAAWKLQRAAWALGFPQGAPVCNTVAAEQEVGPYYVANELLRRDVRDGKPGLRLLLKLNVLDVRTCRPLRSVAIDIWHCDALGLYAGFTKMNPVRMGPGGPPPGSDPDRQGPPPGFDPQHPGNRPGQPEGTRPPPTMHTTDQLTFLRGIQFTDDHGQVEFATVFPGFYMGRTNHIHFKVREGGQVVSREGIPQGKTYIEGHTSHIGQVFFPEDVAAELMRHDPYAKHSIHRTTQAEDGVFQNEHGRTSVARLRAVEANRPETGYTAELIVAVDSTKTPAPVGMRGPGGPMPQRNE
jgi:protocatechuate 3,4-dioxygenase beta subunit